MNPQYSGSHRLAIAAGAAATGGALAILLADPLMTGNWKLDHGLLPIIVGITIAAGHLVGSAVRGRRPLSALGFAAIFVVGTALTIYSSVGSQTESLGNKASNAEAHNAAIAEKRAAIKRAGDMLALSEAMLNASQGKLAAACLGGDGRDCKGVKATIAVYTSAVKGDRTTLVEREAELGRLGGELVARPKAEALGQVAGVFGFDRKRIETAATVLEPFAYSLLLELTAIVAFTFGFAGNRGQDRPAVTVAPIESAATEVAATVATIAPPVMIVEQPLPALVVASATVANRPDSTPPRGGNRRRKLPERRVATRAAAEADVIRLVARGERLPSQDVLARRWGCHKGTASKWLASFEARGLVVRTVAGRSKQVAAALHVVA